MKSLKANFALNSANQLLSIIVPLVTTPYISRVLGAEKLGVFSYANSVTYYFTLFAMLGLANYGGREIAKVRSDEKKLAHCFSGIYYAQLVSSGIVLFIYFIYMLIKSDTMSKIYFINVFAVVFDINWLYYGLEKFDVTLKRNFFVKLISTIGIFSVVKKPEDVYLYAIIMVSSTLAGNLLLWIKRKETVKLEKVLYSEIFVHLKSNLTLFLPIVLTSVYKVMDKLMLKWMTDYSQVGFYENADKLGQVPLFLISSLSQIMIPRISFMLSTDNLNEKNKYFDKSIELISILSTTVIIGIMSVANEFVPVYFGKGYDSCIGLILVLLPSYIFTGYSATIRSQMLIPYGKDKEFAISLAIGAVTNTILNILLIPHFLALGAAVATAFTELVVCFITLNYSKKEINIRSILKNNIIYYFCGICMFILLNTIKYPFNGIILLLFKVFIGAFIYICIFLIFYVLRRKKKIDKAID